MKILIYTIVLLLFIGRWSEAECQLNYRGWKNFLKQWHRFRGATTTSPPTGSDNSTHSNGVSLKSDHSDVNASQKFLQLATKNPAEMLSVTGELAESTVALSSVGASSEPSTGVPSGTLTSSAVLPPTATTTAGPSGNMTATTTSTEPFTKPPPRKEHVFIAMKPHPSDSRYCCRTVPYNVTRRTTYMEEVMVPYVAVRTLVDGIRDLCPSKLYPNRKTVNSCYYYKQQTYTDHRRVTRLVTRLTTQEYYCRIDDLTECCSGYVKYNDDCFSQAYYDRLMMLLKGVGK